MDIVFADSMLLEIKAKQHYNVQWLKRYIINFMLLYFLPQAIFVTSILNLNTHFM